MADRIDGELLLADEVGQALVGDVDPQRLESFQFAVPIMPAFRLVRALFSQSEIDTCLKLMVLFELTRLGGRFSLDRIRAFCRFLDGDRVEGIVRSLREGAWLDLREVDHTYALSPSGVHLLTLLHAADFATLNPANALARAAQSAAFGVTLDGAGAGQAEYLLTQLLVLLENQVEEARLVLQLGRPYRLIEWNRREHGRQLETIQQVLNVLQERLDASSRAFAHVVRLHEAMQETVRLHGGINTRLRQWNLDRLYTAEAGYSVPELLETVLGADDRTLGTAVASGILQAPFLPPSLTFGELKERIHGARRKLPSQSEAFAYEQPPEPTVADWNPAETDAAAELRGHLTRLLRGRSARDGAVEIEVWRRDSTFSGTSWEMALLSRLEGGSTRVALDDGRAALVSLETPLPVKVPASQLLAWLEAHGGLRRLPDGWFARVQIAVEDPALE